MDWIKRASKKAKEMVDGPEASAAAPTLQPAQQVGPIKTQIRELWLQQSNLPHIFRDGGGGGTVDGRALIIFSDGSYTKGPPPVDGHGIVSFTSNSLAVVGPGDEQTPAITRVTDFGTLDKGPVEAVPFLEGETPEHTAVWPNQNISAIDGGRVGVSFPEVIDRDLFRQQKQALVYSTAAEIRVQSDGRPTVARPVQRLFRYGEPLFGSFATVVRDGYLYLFARVSETDTPRSNGLKLARVRPEAWADRTQYAYWDGQAFGPTQPALDDGGAANVFSHSQEIFGKHYGPGTGDVFWSEVYGLYILLFQSQAAALDNSVYLTHSSTLTGGWSTPVSIYKLPRDADGFTYAFHAYPNMDPTGRVVPLTWSQDSKSQSCRIGTAEVLFS